MTFTADRALRGVGIVVIVGLVVLSLVMLVLLFIGAIAWLVVLCFVRAVWGAAAYLAIAGPLVMVGVCSWLVVFVLVVFGFGGFVWCELVTLVLFWVRIRDGGRFVRAQPLLGYLALILGAVAVLHVL